MTYSFGTGDAAARRLLVVAEVFEPTMVRVLGELPRRRWPCVVDLGCGPGSSTVHLGRHLAVDTLVGLDSSPAYAALARRRVPGAAFAVADATRPLPVRRPDLVYARFLLSHLRDPRAVAGAWAGQLGDGGTLVLEEPERIETDDPTFRDYLALVGGLVASRGATMLVGATLASGLPGVAVDRAVAHPVDRTDAARMFRLNLETVRHDPWVRAHYDREHLDQLARDLGAATRTPPPPAPGAAPVVWQVRQVVLVASAGGTVPA